jgi:hypothetical protein
VNCWPSETLSSTGSVVYLHGAALPFTVYTDHATLRHILTQPHLTIRQIDALAIIQNYDYTVRHLPGAKCHEPSGTLFSCQHADEPFSETTSLSLFFALYGRDPKCSFELYIRTDNPKQVDANLVAERTAHIHNFLPSEMKYPQARYTQAAN